MPVDRRKLSQDVKNTQLAFLLNELTTGLTFARMTRTVQGEKRTRMLGQAQAAYNSVLRFIDRVIMTHSDAQRVRRGMETLKKELAELGETF
jgi:hypothetical protein